MFFATWSDIWVSLTLVLLEGGRAVTQQQPSPNLDKVRSMVYSTELHK